MKLSLLLVFTFLLVSIVSCADVKSSAKNQTIEERVRAEIKVWENNWSGFPINCRRMVDTLSEDGVVEYPVGKNIIGGGHRKIFTRCEKFIIENFSQMQTFAHGPVYVNGFNAAFERSTLFITKNNCRLYSRGIVTIQYDKNFKIKVLKDYFDADELVKKYQDCQFPDAPLPDINAGKDDDIKKESEKQQKEKDVKPTETKKDEL
eukprot:gene2275-2802_t